MDDVTRVGVFLVDDHEVVRRGIAELLESTGEFRVVGEAGSAMQAVQRLPGSGAQVAVLDLRLPDGNGIEVCREIRSRFPGMGCLILTSFADDEALIEAAMAGAQGYVSKQVRGTEILDAVRAVARGRQLLEPAVVRRAMERLRRGSEGDELVNSLSSQERRIFDLIGEGLSNRQIADQMFLSEKTIRNYVSNMLAKLGMGRRTEAAALAARMDERRRRRAELLG